MTKFVAEIFLVVGVLIGGFIIWQLIKGLKAKNWPTAPGKVIDSRVSTSYSYDDDGSRSTTYGAEISYSYDVDGYEHKGHRRSFSDFSSSNRRRAEKIVARYAPGTTMPVYYRPEDPEESVLEPGINFIFVVFLLLPAIFVVIGVLGLLGKMD